MDKPTNSPKNWNDFTPIDDSGKPLPKPSSTSASTNWGDFTPVDEPAPRGFGGWARDVAATAVKGAIAVPEMVVGLADIPTGGRVGKFLENEGGAVGFRPKEAKELVNDWHSDATKEAQRKFQEADGFWDKAATAVQNPSLIATAVGESIPSMLAGGVMGRGALAAARGLGFAATPAATTAGAALATKQATIAGAAGEGLSMAGSAAEQIRQETEDGLLTPMQSGAALLTGAAGGVISRLSGGLQNKLGIGDADTMAVQGLGKAASPGAAAAVNPLVQQTAARSIPNQVVLGAINEGLLEELPQSLAEQMLQNVALGKPWHQDLDAAAIMGTLSGGVMGAGAAGLNAYRNSGAPAQADPNNPGQPGQPDAEAAPQPSPGMQAMRAEYEARLADLQAQEQGEAPVRQTTPESVRKVIEDRRAAEMAAGRAVAGPDDEIYQSTGATDPVRQMVKQAADAGGALSSAAVVAIDTGAAGQMQQAADQAQAQAVAQEQAKAGKKADPAAKVDASTGEIAGGAMASWSDDQLSSAFRGAQDRKVRIQIANELQRRRTEREQADLQAELQDEQAAMAMPDLPDNAFASVSEDAGEAPADLFIDEPATRSPAPRKGNSNGTQATQAQQAEPKQPAQPANPAAAGPAFAGSDRQGEAVGQPVPQPGALTNAAPTANNGAQAAPAPGPQTQAGGEATAPAAATEALRTQLREVEDKILRAAPGAMAAGGGDIEAAMKSPKVPVTLKAKRKKLQDQLRAAQPAGESGDGIKLTPAQKREIEAGGTGFVGELGESARSSLQAMRNNPKVPVIKTDANGSYFNDELPQYTDIGSGFSVRGYSVRGDVKQEIKLPNGMVITRTLKADGGITGSAEGNYDQIVEGKGFAEAEKMVADYFAGRSGSAPTLTQGAAPNVTQAGGVSAPRPVDVEAAGVSPASVEYKKQVDTWNAKVNTFETANPEQQTAMLPEMDAARASLERARQGLIRESDAAFKKKQAEQSQKDRAEKSTKYGAMPTGTRIGIAGQEQNDSAYWEKTGPDEWTRVGIGSEQPKRQSADMEGGRVISQPAPATQAVSAARPGTRETKGEVVGEASEVVDAPRLPAAKKPARGVLAKMKAQARAEYFTPGNVVESYSGHDRVIIYQQPDEQGNWSVTVRAVKKQGDTWVDVPNEGERTHSTQPEAKELTRGPVGKVAAPAPSEIDHNGTRIYQTKIRLADTEPKLMWAVESATNKAKRMAGERTVSGDTLHDSLDQAKAAADREAQRDAAESASKAELEAQDKARQAAEEARKAENRGKSVVERRKDAILDGPSKIGQGTKRAVITSAVDNGYAIEAKMVYDYAARKRDQETVDRASRAGYILGVSNENLPLVKAGNEAKARLKEGKYEKPEYRVYQGSDTNAPFREITKTEYDYAQELKAQRAAAQQAEAAPAASSQQATDDFLPEGWTKSINGYTKRPVYRMEQGGGQPFAVVTQVEGMQYEMQIRHGDKQLTVSNQTGALSEVLAKAEAELTRMTQADSVTHQDPGEKPEAATKAVVSESLKTAARNEDAKPSEMRKWLLAEIEKEMLAAPDRADYDETVKRVGEKDAISMYTGNGMLGKNTETGFITFDVPGDGKFKVRNSMRGLLEFRKNVNASGGFKDSGQKTVRPPENKGALYGGSKMDAITNMIEEGDFEAARDYAEAVGIKLDDVKVPKGDRKPQWEAFRKSGALPPQARRPSKEWQFHDFGGQPSVPDSQKRQAVLSRVVDGSEYVATVKGAIDNTGANYEITKDGKPFSAMTTRVQFSEAMGLAEAAMPAANDKPAAGTKTASAEEAPKLDLMGFTRTPTGNGIFQLRDGNLLVEVQPTLSGLQAVHRSAKSSPRLTEQQAIEWAANIRSEAGAESGPADPAPKGRTYLLVPFEEKDLAKVRGAKWDAEKKVWYADPISGGMAEGEINVNLTRFIPEDRTADDRHNYYGDKGVANVVALNAQQRDGVPRKLVKRKHPDEQTMFWSVVPDDQEAEAAAAAQPAAPAQQEGGKPKKLPPFPVDGYRLERFYANGAKVKPLPAKAFSPTEVQAIKDWFKSIGWSVTSGSGANGVNAINDIGMTAYDLPEPYTAAQRKKDEARKAADEREADKQKAQDDYLASTDAGKFVSDMFGDSMNRFNLTALAKVLAGDEKTFGGLFSNRAIDVLVDAGIPTEGRQVKDVVADIKATFDAAQQEAQQASDDRTKTAAPAMPEGYKPAGEPFYREGKLVQGYAPFNVGDRVTVKDSGGQSGVIDSLVSPDAAGVFASAVVKFDNGSSQTAPFSSLKAPFDRAATYKSVIDELNARAASFGLEKIQEETRGKLASLALGRNFGESMEDFLARNPFAEAKHSAYKEWLASGGLSAGPGAIGKLDAEKKTPARVTPQISGNPEKFIKVAADSVRELRSVDVDRVLTETPVQFRAEVASYIRDQRKDLADEVDDVMAEKTAGADPVQSDTPAQTQAAVAPATDYVKLSSDAKRLLDGLKNPKSLTGDDLVKLAEDVAAAASGAPQSETSLRQNGKALAAVSYQARAAAMSSPHAMYQGQITNLTTLTTRILASARSASNAEAPATGTRRDPTKVTMFNPYEDGDIVTIDGQDWTVKQDTPGWYLTNTGNWRGTHPTIRNIKAMADLIRGVEQASVAQADAPKLTQAEAKSLMEWQDMGQTGGVKKHALHFYESQANKDANRGRMTLVNVTKDTSASNWFVEGDDKPFAMLGMAKKRAEELGMLRAMRDGFVESPFSKYEAEASAYGYKVGADGTITKGGKALSPVLKEAGGRLRIESPDGNLLFSGAQTGEALGRFVSKFWGATRESAPDVADQNDRDTFTLQRLNKEAGKMEPVAFKRGETVKLAIGQKPYKAGVITGISHAERKFKVDGNDFGHDFGYAYKADFDEMAAPKAEVDADLDKLEQRLNDENSLQWEGFISSAKATIERDNLGDYAKERIAALSKRAAELSNSVLDKMRAAKAEKEAQDAKERAEKAANEKPLPDVDMTMEEWKATSKDYKTIMDGQRMVLREGGMRKVNIVKPAEAVESKTPTVDRHMEVMESVRAGTATPEQFKASFNAVVDGKQAILAELNTKTKAELQNDYGAWMRYSGDTKADLVTRAYGQIVGQYALGESVSYGMTNGSYEAAVRKMVEATDEAKLQSYMEERKEAVKEAMARMAAREQAIADPKTMADFREVLRAKIRDGMTLQEAFLTLTPEQRIKYDTLAAESTRERREEIKRKAKTQLATAGNTSASEVIATKHTKLGHDLFVVKLADRVERDEYLTLNNSAKRLGGSYSSFRGNGAIPGFQFRNREAAEAFRKLVDGDTTQAQELAAQRRDAFEDDRSQTAVERLRAMAEKLEAQAEEEENRERKTNTAKRARYASSAMAGAAADKAKAKTMRNIADAIEAGNAKFLDEVRTKTQVDMLTAIVATAKSNELRAKHPSYADQEKRRGEPPTAETADFAEFPSYASFRSDLASLARQMLEVEGTKKLGQRLMSVADDVTDTYLEFAKKNISKVSQFGRGDAMADFSNKDDAERAIRRSGLTGKAIVLTVKRGQHRVILSPGEAIGRKIWEGDGDKRITLNGEFGAELVEAIGRRGNKQNSLTVPWQFQNAYDRRKALSRLGIETASEYRSAVREFIALKEQAVVNRTKELELQMVGRKADGLDFFPTPAEVADQMIEAADLSPDMAVLEPSAGMGHLADRIREAGAEPDVIEASEERRELLLEKGYHMQGYTNFLAMEPRKFFTYGDLFRAPDGKEGTMRGVGSMGSQRVRLEDENGNRLGLYDRDELTGIGHRGTWSGYDRIIMNPPFSNRRDAEHVMHAYTLLKPGGRIVAIMGEGVFFGQDKKAQEFRDWLESVGGTSEKLPAGSFMDPSLPVNTSVNARMVVIDKPAGDLVLPSRDDAGAGVNAFRTTRAPGSTQAQLSLDAVKKTVESALRRVVGAPTVQVVARPEDIGLGNPFTSVPKGVTLNDGSVVVFSDGAESVVDVYRTVFHELFHRGSKVRFERNSDYITKMLTIAAGDETVRAEVASWKKSDDGLAKMSEFRENGPMTGERLANYEAIAVEEALATMAERIGMGELTQPQDVIKRIARFLARVADAWGMTQLSHWLRNQSTSETEKFVMETIAMSGGKANTFSTALLFNTSQSADTQELADLFKALEAPRGLKLTQAYRAVDQHPLSSKIREVESNFLDILERLDDAGLVQINC